KFDFSGEVLDAFQAVKAAGSIPKWGVALEATKRRSVMQNELRQVGIKNPGAIAVPSVRNDAAFLATVVCEAQRSTAEGAPSWHLAPLWQQQAA
ncbi:uncharacterized protein HaLaN_19319, partial [Haematococcus lacustris]